MLHLALHLLAIYNPFPTTTADHGAIVTILDILYTIVGAVALLFVTIGGFKYVVSSGDPNETGKAKNTIIYAAIGLAVVLSAAAITNFAIGRL